MNDWFTFRAPAAVSANKMTARWLAQRVLATNTTGLPSDLPAPWLVSELLKRSSRMVRDYVVRWASCPDGDSNFAVQTRGLRGLPASLLVQRLIEIGYDGLVYPLAGSIIGHVFFQRRADAAYGFSVAIDNEFVGKGFSVVMLLDYLGHASRLAGVAKARVGTGGNNVARRLLQRLKRLEASLKWQVGEDGWVTFGAALSLVQSASEATAGALLRGRP